MKRETLISTSLLVVGAIFLTGRIFFSEHGMGKAYVRMVEVKSSETGSEISWAKYENATQRKYHEAVTKDPGQKKYQFSLSRTLCIWIAAFFTLFILSYLYKDNPLYKIAESVVVGVSAAYWMVVGFWTTIVPNLLGKLSCCKKYTIFLYLPWFPIQILIRRSFLIKMFISITKNLLQVD